MRCKTSPSRRAGRRRSQEAVGGQQLPNSIPAAFFLPFSATRDRWVATMQRAGRDVRFRTQSTQLESEAVMSANDPLRLAHLPIETRLAVKNLERRSIAIPHARARKPAVRG